MSDIVLYSCVTNNYDKVEKTLLSSVGLAEPGVRFVLFTDSLPFGGKPVPHKDKESKIAWELRPLVWKHPICSRRTSRFHKVNSHKLDLNADCTIWVDGSQRLKPVSLVTQLVNPLISRYSLASFKHPERTCVYQEMQACRKYRKDNPILMRDQINAYKLEGYPPYNGLVETACVLRKQTTQIEEFNRLWWDQICKYSYRDQLSFNYVAWKLGLAYGKIPGCRLSSKFFEFVRHGKSS